MQMLEVDEYYETYLRGKTEHEIREVIQELKSEIASLEKKVDAMAKEEKECRTFKDKFNKWFFRLGDDWHESYELGCAKICLDYDRLYLERAKRALMGAKSEGKCTFPPHCNRKSC